MYKNFRVGGGIVLGLSALVLSLAACTAAIDRNSDNSVKRGAADFTVGSVNYKLCTSVDDIISGANYIFSCDDEKTEKFVGFSGTTGSIYQWDKQSTNANITPVTLNLVSETKYNLVANDIYLIAKSGDKNTFSSSTNASTATWSISFDNGRVKMTNNSKNIYYNTSNGLFRPYADKTGNAAYFLPRLYKVVTEQKAYTVTFETNGGTSVAAQSVDTAQEIDLEAATPTKQYANFKGWYLDAELTNPFNKETYEITSDITLYAKWATTRKVNFYNEGSIINTTIVEENTTVTAPEENPKKASDDIYEYTFSHWSLTENGEAFDFNTLIKKVTNLYAVYTKNYKSLAETVLEFETNSNVRFDYTYVKPESERIIDTIPNKLSTGSGTATLNNGSYTYNVSAPYDKVDTGTGFRATGTGISYVFNEPAFNPSLTFDVKFNGASGDFVGKLEIILKDSSNKDIGTKVYNFNGNDGNTETIKESFEGYNDVKTIKLAYTKTTGNLGVGAISISADPQKTIFKDARNVKLDLGYVYTLGNDERVVETGILVTAINNYKLPETSASTLPTDKGVATFANKLLEKDFYISVNYAIDLEKGVNEVKDYYERIIYVIPYVKEATGYVYGNTHQTSLKTEVSKVDNPSLVALFNELIA